MQEPVAALGRKSSELNAGRIFMVQTFDMPVGLTSDGSLTETPNNIAKAQSYGSGAQNGSLYRQPSDQPQQQQQSKHTVSGQPTPVTEMLPGAWPQSPGSNGVINGSVKEGIGGLDGSFFSVPTGRKSSAPSMRSRRSATNLNGQENERKSGEVIKETTSRIRAVEEGNISTNATNGKPAGPFKSPVPRPIGTGFGENAQLGPVRSISHGSVPLSGGMPLSPAKGGGYAQSPKNSTDGMLKPPNHAGHQHRASSPPAFNPNTVSLAPVSSLSSRPVGLQHRHTLEVPKVNTSRTSRDGLEPTGDVVVSPSGRFSPNTPTRRRGSLQLGRKVSRSIGSDMHWEEVPQDEDAVRWADHIRAKRASKRNRIDTDDERVVVGTKVDENHVNWVTAYNMLTGIRFVVSRTNAKMNRPLTDADFQAKHKFSFDITGNELTPSAKYDFKFKDYAPWVFRHLRAQFKLDPAEYLMSLTSKYILSELGSPGKSGSFFYFSRDYKYIIKTIHHGEHKFLRKILKDYYQHVIDNPNTLLSQFYGLHRVKIPYGRKIHFVVMNNLFPPHRDIHRTFDLKGSTIGRDFKEDDLEKNPRATLKDLNWLRRNLHLEFGPTKKDTFVEQMQRDVKLLQRLKIMDYSLLVGIHDLGRGNDENLRDKTLQVFQPDVHDEPKISHDLIRTPSKMETAKRARELREMVKKQRPVPMDQTIDKMPEMSHKNAFYFYADDGGFRATHEDNSPGEEIYYLGIIDCLTRYNVVKKAEHFWKGMGGHESQISPIPPERYGDRFVKFISGITMSRERAEKERLSQATEATVGDAVASAIDGTINDPRLGGVNIHPEKTSNPEGTAEVMEQAEHEAEKSRRRGASEEDVPDRSLATIRGRGDSQTDAPTLPVIGEAAESASNASRTPKVSPSNSREDMNKTQQQMHRIFLGSANMPADSVGEVPPPTPPKMDNAFEWEDVADRSNWGGGLPPTPPKDPRYSRLVDRELPVPPSTSQLSPSPSRMSIEDRLTLDRMTRN